MNHVGGSEGQVIRFPSHARSADPKLGWCRASGLSVALYHGGCGTVYHR